MWHMEQNLRADLSLCKKGCYSTGPSLKLVKDGVLGSMFPSWIWEMIVLTPGSSLFDLWKWEASIPVASRAELGLTQSNAVAIHRGEHWLPAGELGHLLEWGMSPSDTQQLCHAQALPLMKLLSWGDVSTGEGEQSFTLVALCSLDEHPKFFWQSCSRQTLSYTLGCVTALQHFPWEVWLWIGGLESQHA